MSEKDRTGMIADIISFSLNDGPGIRTTVFLKGCPVHCKWCHNPENQHMKPQIMWYRRSCIHCGKCSTVCPSHVRMPDGTITGNFYDACSECGKCIAVCPVGANKMVGKRMTAEEVVREILKDKDFFRERGGVTFSGGEPLMQADFVAECERLLTQLKINCAVETSLCMPWEFVEPLLDGTKHFLCDWKISDSELHKKMIGIGNEIIFDNLCRLDREGAEITLRCPVIPGVNDNSDHFEFIGKLTHQLSHILQVDLLPYHDIGNDKRRKIGLGDDGFVLPSEDEKSAWLKQLREVCAVPVHM